MLRRLAGRLVAGLATVARAFAAALDTWARRWDGAPARAGGPPADWVAKVRANAPWLLEPPDEMPDAQEAWTPPPAQRTRPQVRSERHMSARRRRSPAPADTVPQRSEPASSGTPDGAVAHRAETTSSVTPHSARRRTWPALRDALATQARTTLGNGLATAKQVVDTVRLGIEDVAPRRAEQHAATAPGPVRRDVSSGIPVTPAGRVEPAASQTIATQEPKRPSRRRERNGTPRPRPAPESSTPDQFPPPMPEPGRPLDHRPPRDTRQPAATAWSQSSAAYAYAEAVDPAPVMPRDTEHVLTWPDLPAAREEGAPSVVDDEGGGAWPDLPPGLADDDGPSPETLGDRDHRASLDAELRSL